MNVVTFNQDESLFCYCELDGTVKIYNMWPVRLQLKIKFPGSVTQCQVLNRSNYMGLICGFDNTNNEVKNVNINLKPMFSDNEVVIWDDLLKKSIIRLKYMETVKKLYFNRVTLVVHTISKIYIYKFKNPPELIHTLNAKIDSIIYYHKRLDSNNLNPQLDNFLVFENGYGSGTNDNIISPKQQERSEINPNSTNFKINNIQNFDANINDYSYNQTPNNGQLTIFNTITGKSKIIKTGHRQKIGQIVMSSNCKFLATSSINGTIIKIFTLNNGLLYQEFRRSIEIAPIYQLKFNPVNKLLCCISTKQTLHIFQIKYSDMDDIDNKANDNENENKNKINSGNLKDKFMNTYYSSLSLLPKDTKLRDKSICSIKLINPTIRENTKVKFNESDRCFIHWINNETIILIWLKYKIYEKYLIKFDTNLDNFYLLKDSWNFFE